jgi:shikimate kinase
MESKKNVVLVGMMGSGKSTVGHLISKKLNINFIDTDTLIEKVTKMKISEIFSKKSEKYFRDLEEEITIESLGSTNTVISLGGGAFINKTIRTEVIKHNFSFWLNLDAPTILKRIKKNKKRPIVLKLKDDELIKLIETRAKIYSKAKFKIDCKNLSKAEIVKKIIELYECN